MGRTRQGPGSGGRRARRRRPVRARNEDFQDVARAFPGARRARGQGRPTPGRTPAGRRAGSRPPANGPPPPAPRIPSNGAASAIRSRSVESPGADSSFSSSCAGFSGRSSGAPARAASGSDAAKTSFAGSTSGSPLAAAEGVRPKGRGSPGSTRKAGSKPGADSIFSISCARFSGRSTRRAAENSARRTMPMPNDALNAIASTGSSSGCCASARRRSLRPGAKPW